MMKKSTEKIRQEKSKQKLAFLKENRFYRQSHERAKETILKPAENLLQDQKKKLLKGQTLENPSFFFYPAHEGPQHEMADYLWQHCPTFGIETPSFPAPFFHLSEDEIKILLDPEKDISQLSQKAIQLLANLFEQPTINIDMKSKGAVVQERNGTILIQESQNIEPEPYERLLKLDMRRKKADILFEINSLIDREQKRSNKYADSERWNPDNTRSGKEAWSQLKIWQLWKKGQGFKQIATQIDMTYDAVKMAFHKGYERIYNRPYNIIDVWENESRSVPMPDIKQFCKNCSDYPCKTPCPEYLEFIENYISQDSVKQKEISVSQINVPESEDPLSYLKEKNKESSYFI